MFREVSKFFMLASLSAAFFLGVAAEGIKRYLSKDRISSRFVRRFTPVFLISLIILLTSLPFLTGDIGGSVGTAQIPENYKESDNWLSNESGDFRIAFFPPAIWATSLDWAPRMFLNPYVALQDKPTVELKSEQDLTESASLVRCDNPFRCMSKNLCVSHRFSN